MTDNYQTKNYYEGIAPDGQEWTAPFNLGVFNNRNWWICISNAENKWKNIKVFSLEKKQSKANFNLSHNM